METVDISILSLTISLILFIVPIILSKLFQLQILKSLFQSTIRMTIQLILIGIFLKYLFLWNNTLINIGWLFVMVFVAVFSAITGASMKRKKIFLPIFLSFSLTTFCIVIFLNTFVIKLTYVFDARYLIVLSGMILGNSLRGNIVGITTFYQNIKKDSKTFKYTLALGADFNEAILPYLQNSLQLALKPTLAAMATMGIVALPGMMTGVILGGISPIVAIKYQIMIMIAIAVGTITSVVLTILMTLRTCFCKYGTLKNDIF